MNLLTCDVDIKRLLVFINPKSGSGSAQEDFVEAQKYFHGYHVKEFIVRNKGEIRQEIAKVLRTGLKIDAFLFFMGDGPIHQEVKELISQDIPICIFPSGTGNGIAYSILDQAGVPFKRSRKFSVITMAELLKAGYRSDFSLPVISIGGVERVFFLAWTAGIIAKCDAFGEKSYLLTRFPSLRKILGSFRYDLGGIWELIRMNSHLADLRFQKLGEKDLSRFKGRFLLTMVSNCRRIDKNVPVSNSLIGSKPMTLTYLKAVDVTRLEFARILLGLDKGSLMNHPKVNQEKVSYVRYEPLDSGNKIMLDGEPEEAGKIVEIRSSQQTIPIVCSAKSVGEHLNERRGRTVNLILFAFTMYILYKSWKHLNPYMKITYIAKLLNIR